MGDVLQFARDGSYLLVADEERVSAYHTTDTTRRSVHIVRQHVRALAGFDVQIWLVADGALHRHDLDGRSLGEPFELPNTDDAGLSPAPCGPAGAVWLGHPAVGIVDDLGTLIAHSHANADLIVPLTPRRAVAIMGARVQMPSGVTTTLPPGTRVLGGLVLVDGKSVVLATVCAGHRELVMIALGTGQHVTRMAVASELVRVAMRRAISVVRLDERRIGVVDLRVGRELGSFVVDRRIDDFAVDPDGRRIAVRCEGELEIVELSERLVEARAPRARGTMPPSVPDDDPQPIEELDRSRAPATAHDRDTPIGLPVDPVEDRALPGPILALSPRGGGPRLAREHALACLELERALILARVRAGIAAAWDSRRLGYANESAHPFELEVMALLGTGRGHAEDHVAGARRDLTAASDAREADRQRWFDASPLAELASDFALTRLDLDILIAVAAPTLWGETARLYGVLANDPSRGVVDEMLVAQLLDGTAGRYEIAAALGLDTALRRHAIVVANGDRPRPFTHLAINPIVAARLCGSAIPLPDAIAVREVSTPLDELVLPESAGRVFGELARRAPPLRLVVRGRKGSGRRSVLAAIAARSGRALGLIELDQLTDAAHELRGLLRSANLYGLVPCVVGSSTNESSRRAIADAIAAHAGAVLVVLGSDEPSPVPSGHLELVLSPLPAGMRLDHWRRALDRRKLRVADPEVLSSRYRLAPGLVERAVEHVARDGGRVDDATDDLVAAIRQRRDARLDRLATRVTRLPRWSDVVLPPEVLDSLRELIGRVRHGRRVYEEWGFDAVMSTGRGLTALFDGRPGTGKTMVAGVVARELDLDLYRVDLSRLVSKWIGETEKNLAELFDAVDDGQAIILFDEADSLFARRTEVKSSNDRYANLEVNYLLQRIDSFEGIAILTTNFGGAIDPAFRRRVALRLSFPFPDDEAREQLWRVHLPARLPIDGALDLGTLARRFQLSGGYIRNACLRAAFLAAQEDTTLAQRHLERAVHLEFQQIGKISTSGPVE